MGFTVSALTDYVDQTSTELLFTLQFEGETAKFANVQTGIKSAEALQIVTNTPVPQDGASCGFNASGDTAFTQRNLVVKSVKYQDSYCPRTLETKWTQLLLKKGQHYDESDIPKAIIDDIINQINRINETSDWKGDTLTGSAFLNKYDGLIKIIKAATGTTVATAQAGPVTTSNVRALFQNVIAAIPAAQKGDPNTKIFAGYDIAELYRQKMFIDNLYHFPAGADQKGIAVEGSVHMLVPVHGLDGLGANTGDNPFVFALDPDRNMYLGVDMENEHEQAKMWVDGSDGETVKYSFRFKRGWQIAFPSEIVEYSNT
jgi:hypothetical protein